MHSIKRKGYVKHVGLKMKRKIIEIDEVFETFEEYKEFLEGYDEAMREDYLLERKIDKWMKDYYE